MWRALCIKCTQNMTCFVYQVYTECDVLCVSSVHNYSTSFLFLGVVLVLYQYIFPWQKCFYLGGCPWSASSCVQVNMVMWTKVFGSVHIVQKTHWLQISVQANTYKLGPRSDENSQWKIKIFLFPSCDVSFPLSVSPVSVSCFACLMSTYSLKICSLVYTFLAPLMWPPSYSYG